MVKTNLYRVSRAAEQAVSAMQIRDETIRHAHQTGASIRAIAKAANLSPARVHQIIHKIPRGWT